MPTLINTNEHIFERGIGSLLKWENGKKKTYKNPQKKVKKLKNVFYHDKLKILSAHKKNVFNKNIKPKKNTEHGPRLTFLDSFTIIHKMRKNIVGDNFSISHENSFKKNCHSEISFTLRLFFFIIKTFPHFNFN
jgi:hypothetical protein